MSTPPEEHAVGLAVVGASAGGVEALKGFVHALPADLRCPVVVVLHVSATGTSVLPQILERSGVLRATSAQDGDVLEDGHVYVAPPDSQVLVTASGLRLSAGPPENGHRPAVNPTMRSAAQAFDGRTVGIILSGTRDDGTAGLAAIKANGGRVLVQDPAEALYDGMPISAMEDLAVDGVLPVAELAAWLAAAARGEQTGTEPHHAKPPADMSFRGAGLTPHATRFTCPDCGGVLSEVPEGIVLRLECPVGHAFSPESLSAEQGRELERTLWTATRGLDDRAVLLERMASRSRISAQPRSAAAFEAQAAAAREHASVIRRSMLSHDDAAAAPAGAAEAR